MYGSGDSGPIPKRFGAWSKQLQSWTGRSFLRSGRSRLSDQRLGMTSQCYMLYAVAFAVSLAARMLLNSSSVKWQTREMGSLHSPIYVHDAVYNGQLIQMGSEYPCTVHLGTLGAFYRLLQLAPSYLAYKDATVRWQMHTAKFADSLSISRDIRCVDLLTLTPRVCY